MKRLFSKDPKINWVKVMCPACGEPTGPSSECHRLEKSEQEYLNPSLIHLPIFTEVCPFRQSSLWYVHFNYGISKPLLKILSSIDGVSTISPIDTYSLQIAIGMLFDQKEVQSNINSQFRNFIKTMSSIEADLKKEQESIKPKSIGIRMPNGNIHKIENPTDIEVEMYRLLQSEIVDSQLLED